jgi:hypothetical protein
VYLASHEFKPSKLPHPLIPVWDVLQEKIGVKKTWAATDFSNPRPQRDLPISTASALQVPIDPPK